MCLDLCNREIICFGCIRMNVPNINKRIYHTLKHFSIYYKTMHLFIYLGYYYLINANYTNKEGFLAPFIGYHLNK